MKNKKLFLPALAFAVALIGAFGSITEVNAKKSGALLDNQNRFWQQTSPSTDCLPIVCSNDPELPACKIVSGVTQSIYTTDNGTTCSVVDNTYKFARIQ